MPSKVIVTGIILIIIVTMLVFTVEFFVPLSMKGDMNILCRRTLLEMEIAGGLMENARRELVDNLQSRGFSSVSATGTAYAKQGELLNLRVEVQFNYSKLTTLFSRNIQSINMVYDKTSLSRKVVN